ncbi:hypothetical protein H2200_007487 [Cladophialophora chaetospira]|uniref:Uncharacterized protein n=1 Tax=Cladophialophora chaetospira TaxID=386627 RepID=A0AA38X812_9EURO|nr:hypothetical protein H2200_007487 [Cladophialophora chaetospira]
MKVLSIVLCIAGLAVAAPEPTWLKGTPVKVMSAKDVGLAKREAGAEVKRSLDGCYYFPGSSLGDVVVCFD